MFATVRVVAAVFLRLHTHNHYVILAVRGVPLIRLVVVQLLLLPQQLVEEDLPFVMLQMFGARDLVVPCVVVQLTVAIHLDLHALLLGAVLGDVPEDKRLKAHALVAMCARQQDVGGFPIVQQILIVLAATLFVILEKHLQIAHLTARMT